MMAGSGLKDLLCCVYAQNSAGEMLNGKTNNGLSEATYLFK